jgi:hypothetical protein
MKRWWTVLPLALALGGCSMAQDMKGVGQAVDGFHRQLDAGQFDAIYAAGSDDLKRITPQERFTALLSAVHRKLGAFRSGGQNGFNDTVNTSGHIVAVQYRSTYARGAAAETFTFRIVDGAPKLAGYNINSDALILN